MGSLDCEQCKSWLKGVYFKEHRKRKLKFIFSFLYFQAQTSKCLQLTASLWILQMESGRVNLTQYLLDRTDNADAFRLIKEVRKIWLVYTLTLQLLTVSAKEGAAVSCTSWKSTNIITCLIFLQIFKGIEFIHSKHYVHLDIKPDNIVLTTTNNIKLTDFGTATRGSFRFSLYCILKINIS